MRDLISGEAELDEEEDESYGEEDGEPREPKTRNGHLEDSSEEEDDDDDEEEAAKVRSSHRPLCGPASRHLLTHAFQDS